jgi:hypothetical protein
MIRRSPALAALILATVATIPAVARQEPAPAEPAGGASSTPSKTERVADLTLRYRFGERYVADEAQVGPGLIGPYRVAVLDELRDSVEAAQGAPRRVDSTRQVIYAERPASLGPLGVVVTSARRVEAYVVKPEEPSKRPGPKLLDGISVLIRPKLGDRPLILCLTDDRTLTEAEYLALSRDVYVPHLAALLPLRSVRLGDTWRVDRKGAQALLGDPFLLQADTLTGKLMDVRKEVEGSRMVASIALTGKVAGASGETTVNAELSFTFTAALPTKDPARKPTFPPSPTEDLVEAQGAITELRLATLASGPLPGPGRLRFLSSRKLTMHRQLGLAAGTPAPPALAEIPEPTSANSWLTHVDPAGRYGFRHPEDFLPPERTQPLAVPDTSLLVRTSREGRELLQVEYFAKTLTPEDLKKELAEKSKALKLEVVKGEEKWLPDAEWPGMRVHRIDADLKVADGKLAKTGSSGRIHVDSYLIQFPRSVSILAVASTSRPTVAAFRAEIEQALKTLQLDPAPGLPLDKAPRPPGEPAPAPR